MREKKCVREMCPSGSHCVNRRMEKERRREKQSEKQRGVEGAGTGVERLRG